MLTLTGTCLGVTRETVQGPNGPWESVKIVCQIGEGIRTRTEYLRVARAFDQTTLPLPGDDFACEVSVQAFRTKEGAGYAFYALRLVESGARVSTPA